MAFRKSGLTWIVLLLSVTLSGCISRWTEDVELGDGTIIKVTRTEKYGGGGGIGESCLFCTFEWARLSFEHKGKKYRWKSLDKSEVPMIVDIVNDIPVVVSHPATAYCPKKSRADEYYFYVYSIGGGDSWGQVFNMPSGIRKTRNLHWYKPKYASGLSVMEKNDWASKRLLVGGDYEKPTIMIVDGAASRCASWHY